jgi:S-DNA-T family DNA segregation ATPase FtsK/SpoIIIE
MTRMENSIALGALVVVTAGSLYGDSFGAVGRWVSAGLTGVVGAAAWLVPIWIADVAVRTFLGRPKSLVRFTRWVGLIVLCALSLTLLAELPGGWIGATLAAVLATTIGVGAVLLVLGTWAVVLLRLLGRDRVETISQHVVHASQVAIVHRPRLMRSSGPVFAPVIDTVGESVTPPPLPVPVPAPPVPGPAVQPPSSPTPRPLPRKPSSWSLPDISLLQEPSRAQVDSSYREAVARNLGERLRHFRLNATVAASEQQGAVVSRYEITPSASQELKPIMARAADLEAAYKGLRFVQLPGTGKLGVEIPVPDAHRGTIALRTVLDSEAWTESDAALPLALGVTASGEPVVIDLAACPHLLAAGATGSGKSVGVNCMLASMLLRYSPDQLQLILIDPKMVEFARYRSLPHLVCPVVTETAEAIEKLRWAVEEMERRYQRFVAADVEKYDEYIEATGEKLPRIVIVIDEYADLVTVDKDAVEGPVVRIAQKARAAGIHLILATQRPSVDVITGVIKANFPARIAYKVSQRQDSTTIIGGVGAEKLLGCGDSLCLIPQLSIELVRVHGAFVSKEEVRAVCQSWTSQTSGERKPEPPRKTDPVIVEPEERPAPRQLPAPADDLFPRAVEVARAKGHVSARLLVEELHCGFGKAKKLFARMHEQNLIKPGGPNNTHVFCGGETP